MTNLVSPPLLNIPPPSVIFNTFTGAIIAKATKIIIAVSLTYNSTQPACKLTLLYFYPEMFSIKYKELLCKDNSYDQKLLLNYEITKDIKFGKEDKLSSIDVYKVYTFVDSNSYYEFKDNKLYEHMINQYAFNQPIDDLEKYFICKTDKFIYDHIN